MTTQIQVKYKPSTPNGTEEVELLTFQSASSADKFLASVIKSNEVAHAKKL